MKMKTYFKLTLTVCLIASGCARRISLSTPATSSNNISIKNPETGGLDIKTSEPTIEPELPQPKVDPQPKKEPQVEPSVKKIEPPPSVTTSKSTEPKIPTTPTTPKISTVPTTPIQKTEIKTKVNIATFFPLVWEKVIGIAKNWSKMIYSIIENEEPQLLGQNSARDVEYFCPNYRNISDSERMNFWGQLIAKMSEYESGWDPTNQFTEKTMSTDSVTKKQVKSEGLLQLSYQDDKNYPIDCGFNWEHDKNLTTKDPRKTILDPYLNLRCGIKILSYQLKKYGSIVLENNVYWAILKKNGRYNKIKEIAQATRSLRFCQP